MSINRARWGILAVTGLIAASVAYGQIRSATITGAVTDASGGLITGAQVVATSQETSIANSTKTTEAGAFTIPYLPSGTYTVAVTAQGFADYRQTGVVVTTGQTVRIDVAMKVAALGTAVEVSAQAVSVQTDSATVQGSISSKAIDILPNPTSNPLYYAFFQAGVVPRVQATDTTGINSFGIGTDGRRQWSAIGVNGGRAWTNDIHLDGLPVMGGGYNEAAVMPNTEGLEEVRVIANNFSAQYGHGQAVLSMSTKSGTNQYHGDVSYNLRNEALMANSRSNKANWSEQRPLGDPRPPFKVHEFGGSVGGPILKDRLFFFTSYHFLRFNRGSMTTGTVPTALERVGNFSKTMIADESGNPVNALVFDPYNVTQLGPDLFQRAPIPNADLSGYPGSQYAKKWWSYYPDPNRTPDEGGLGRNNFQTPIVQQLRRHSLNSRIDYRLGRHSIYGSGGLSRSSNTTPRPFGKAPFNDAARIQSDDNPYAQIGDTIVVNPTVVIDFRYGVARINTVNQSGNHTGFTAEDYTAFGVPQNIWPYFAEFGAAPVIAGFGTFMGLSDGQFGSKHEGQLNHSAAASLTKMRGGWTHKFGFEARNLMSNYTDFEEASVQNPSTWFHQGGNFNFEYVNKSGGSASQNTTIVQRGLGAAQAMLGVPGWWIRPGANVALALSQKYMALYSQNDWRATSKLTLNIGFRWDLQPGPTERYNRMSSIDLTARNPFGSQGAVVMPGVNGYSRNMWNTRYNNIGPRFGAAYQLDTNTVLRGGLGVTYLPSNSGYFASAVDYGSGSFSSGTMQQPYGPNPNGVPAFHLWEPVPLNIALGDEIANPALYGVAEAKFDRYFKNGRSMQYNFFIERRFASTWMASVGYSASRSDNLFNRNFPIQNNQLIPANVRQQWSDSYIASSMKTNPYTIQVANPWQPVGGPLHNFAGSLGAATIQQQNIYNPYPLLMGTGLNQSRAWARYHSMQLRLSHQFASGFMMDLNYTWSKEIDNSDTMEDNQLSNPGGTATNPDIKNLRNNLRLGGNDVPHRLTGTFLLDLPFGNGKALDLGTVGNAILGGWQTGSTLTLQSGFPIFIRGLDSGALIGHPIRAEGVPYEVPKELQKWYGGTETVTLPNGRKVRPAKNTFLKYYSGAFWGPTITLPDGKTQAAQNWVGGVANNLGDMRGPGRFNIDLTLRRNIRIRERYSLEIAAEASNALNNSQQSGSYNGNLGSTVVTPNLANGLAAGMASSDTYGTINTNTFNPREVVMNLRLRF